VRLRPSSALLLVAAAALLASNAKSSPLATAPAATAKTQYLYELETEALSGVLLTINGVVLRGPQGPPVQRGGGPINQWLRPGQNAAHVRGATGATPPHLKLSISADDSPSGGSRRSVITFEWPPLGKPAPPTLDREITFDVDAPPPCQLWSKAAPIELDTASRSAILDAAGALHRAIAARDMKRARALTDFRDRDVGRCFHLSEHEALALGRDSLEQAMQRGARTDPWKPDEAELTVIEDGRLVAVTARGKPAIRVSLNGGAFMVPVYVAHLAGKWLIAR
jgi:hypothetical protein